MENDKKQVTELRNKDRRDLIKTSALTAGTALLGINATSSMAAEFERQDISGPPEHNPASEYVFSITAEISGVIRVGNTTTGQVRAIPITGGSVEGENFSGIVVPGGADWQRTRKDNVTEIEATYAIQLQGRSDEQTMVKVVNKGLIVMPDQAGGDPYFKTRIMFTAPEGEFDWMNKAVFLSRVQGHPELDNAVLIEVFRLI